MLNIAVFVSGRGSNLQAIIQAIPDFLDKVTVKAVVSNKIDCKASEIASSNNIPMFFVADLKKDMFLTYAELTGELSRLDVDLIVLAGFLKKIPDEFVLDFNNRIINIHPALLPSFGGKGMYGMNVHKAVFNSSVKISGPTVHFVDSVYDNGKIIAQSTVDISDVKTPEEIAERVLRKEHEILPYVLKKFSENKVSIVNNRVFIED